MNYVPPTPEEIEQWRAENRETLKELRIYYGSWDKLREVIYDIEQAESESNWENFVEDYYSDARPLTLEEQCREAQKLK